MPLLVNLFISLTDLKDIYIKNTVVNLKQIKQTTQSCGVE